MPVVIVVDHRDVFCPALFIIFTWHGDVFVVDVFDINTPLTKARNESFLSKYLNVIIKSNAVFFFGVFSISFLFPVGILSPFSGGCLMETSFLFSKLFDFENAINIDKNVVHTRNGDGVVIVGFI